MVMTTRTGADEVIAHPAHPAPPPAPTVRTRPPPQRRGGAGTGAGGDPTVVGGAPARPSLRPRASVPRPRWWIEVALLWAAYALYAAIRDRQGDDTSPAAFTHAVANAGRVVRLEHSLGLYHELDLQRWLLDSHVLIGFFDVIYATAHVTVTAAVLVWVFVRHPSRYRRARTALLVTTTVALAAFWAFPTAPPRLLADAGFTDTLARVGGLWSFRTPVIEHIADPFAAMPSLHLAWATWCALALLPGCRRWWTRAAVGAYPALVVAVVVATGNHYFVDVIAGSALALAAWSLAGLVHRRRHKAVGGAGTATLSTADELGDATGDDREDVALAG